MNRVFFLPMTIAILLLAAPGNSNATDSVSKKRPWVVLVQLRSENNRITALTKARRYKEVEEVKKDAKEVASKMRMDFHDNFDYCSVYFFMDTNADLIKKKKFDGILQNENGEVVPLPPILDTITENYLIVYYGYALSQPKYKKVLKDTSTYIEDPKRSFIYEKPGPWVKNSSKYTYDPDPPNGKGLVILNSKFLQVNNFYLLGYDGLFFSGKKEELKTYSYQSKHFEIDYYPLAGLFNKTLLSRYGDRRIIENPTLYKQKKNSK